MSTRTDSRSPSTTLFRSLRPFLRQVSQAHRRAEQRGTADQANGQVTIAIGLVGSDLLAQLADISRQLGIFRAALRSEEHTSELQSLMRISYAVFCLNKKTTHYYYQLTLTTNYP